MDKKLRETIVPVLGIQEHKIREIISHKTNIITVQNKENIQILNQFEEFKQQTQVLRKIKNEFLTEVDNRLQQYCEEGKQRKEFEDQQLENETNRLMEQENHLFQIQTFIHQLAKDRAESQEKEREKEYFIQEVQNKINLIEKRNKEVQEDDQKNLSEETLETELVQDIAESDEQRGYWNNLLQEAKGNIRVYCRIRPNSNEDMLQINQCSLILKVPEKFLKSSNCSKESNYNFERIFGQDADQSVVYGELSDLIANVVDGYNVCIFAYGQTGSGKTFTMQGDDKNKGVIPKAVEQIFSEISSYSNTGGQIITRVGFQEIYNESCRDLIQNQKCEEFQLQEVKTVAQIFELFHTALNNRKVAETECNEESSRSHFIFQLNLQGNQPGKILNSTLNLIDLAGSERANVAKTEGDRFIETKAINKSLSALGDVFNALYTKQQHVPYRNSKLTYSLYKYMEGSSKTLMMVNVSAKSEDFQQTLASLRFAEKVKQCQIKKQ